MISGPGGLVKVAGFHFRGGACKENVVELEQIRLETCNDVRIVTQRRISKPEVNLRGVSGSGKIALVTLVRSSSEDFSDSAELIAQIRDKLRLSRITKQWSIEKITILDEPPAKTGIQRASKEDDLTVP